MSIFTFVYPLRFVAVVTLLALCLQWTPMVLAADAAEAELQEKAEEYNQKHDGAHEQVVCKKEARTGSRIKKPVCRRVIQTEQQQDEARRTLMTIQRSPRKDE